MQNYNPKIDYLLAKFTDSSYSGSFDEYEWKAVYSESVQPLIPEQARMMKIKSAISYIKSIDGEVSCEAIKQIYFLIADSGLAADDVKCEELLAAIASYRDHAPARAYIKIVREQIFPLYNSETAILIHTMLRIRDGQLPIIFYPVDVFDIDQAIAEGQESKAIIDKIAMISTKTLYLNVAHELITKEVLTDKLLNLKTELRERFGVISLSLYGSYAKHEENVYSDLDILADVDEAKKPDLVNKYRLFKFLKKELGIHVDGKVKDDEYREMKIDMNRYLELLF